jgi:hypothetical protein
MDVEAIPPGSKFSDYIRDAVGACDVLFVLIGPQWLTAIDEDGKRRLEEDDDFVSLEIKAALERDVPVIPTLVGEATMPRKQDLPEHLKPLSDFQNFVISDRSWHDDCARLAKNIQGIVGEPSAGTKSGNRSKMVIAAAACVAVLIAAFFFWYNSTVQSPESPGGTTRTPPTHSDDSGPARVEDTAAATEPGASRPSTTAPAVEPEESEPEEPAAPQQLSILDAGLEGKWELKEIVGQGKPQDEVTIGLARAGDILNIVLQPGEQKFMLDVKPDILRLTSPDGEGYATLKRETAQQQRDWILTVVEKYNANEDEKLAVKGSVKISEDWHRFIGRLILYQKKKDKVTFSLNIDQGEKKAELTWGLANESERYTFIFHRQ